MGIYAKAYQAMPPIPQRPSEVPYPTMPTPANDNDPWNPPTPDNDNEPGQGRPKHRGGLGRLFRQLPYLGGLYAAYEAYQHLDGADVSYWAPNGWTSFRDCENRRPAISGQASQAVSSLGQNASLHGQVLNCVSGQALIATWGTALADARLSLAWMPHTSDFGLSPRFQMQKSWFRPAVGPAIHPRINLFPAFWPAPGPMPALEPMSVPIGRPMPTPRPVPHPAVPHLPRTSPTPEGNFRSNSSSGGRDLGRGRSNPRVRPRYRTDPSPPPRITIRPPRLGVPKIVPKPKHNDPRRIKDKTEKDRVSRARGRRYTRTNPGRGVKERKLHMRSAIGTAAWLALGSFTEALDNTYVIFAALPAHLRQGWRYPPPHIAWELIYRHWDEIDLPTLMEGILTNEVEDFLYGRLGKLVGRGRNKLFRETGANFTLSRIPQSRHPRHDPKGKT